MTATAATVELCGEPDLAIGPDHVQYIVRVHSSDPASTLHAEIALFIRPSDGYFWFEPSWLI